MTVKLNLIDRKKTRNLKACHTSAEERLLRRRLAHSKRSSERARVGHVGCVVQNHRLGRRRSEQRPQSPAAGAAQQPLLRQYIPLPCSWVGSASGDFLTPRGVRRERTGFMIRPARRPGIVCVISPCAGAELPFISNLNAHNIREGGARGSIPRQGFPHRTEPTPHIDPA
jgi:hypothetical protein